MRLVLKLMMSPIRRGFTPLVWRAAVVAGISLTANVRGAREAGGLYGRIIDAESGEPVVAAKVMLGKDGLIRFSDGDGMFRYTDLRPRRYTLSVAATGYSPWVLSGVRVEPGVDVSVGIELRASRPVTAACDTCPAPSLLLGRVTDAKEAGAIKGASILIPSLDMAAETGDDGYFSVAGVQEGTYDVVVGHAEYAADTVHDIAVGPRGPAHVRVRLMPVHTARQSMGTIVGRVRDSASGEAIMQASVSLLNTEYTTLSDTGGHFELADIPVGNYTLLVTKWGYEAQVLTNVGVTDGEQTSREVMVAEREAGLSSGDGGSGAISGVVTDENGDPYENARVFLREGNGTALTDFLGRFRLDTVPGGVYAVGAVAEGFDTTWFYDVDVWNGEESRITIRLRPHVEVADSLAVDPDRGLVRGVIVDAETQKPLSGVKVGIPSRNLKTVTDLRGRYVLNGIRPGVVSLTAEHDGFARIEREVDVRKGRKVQVDLLMSSSEVTRMQRMTVRSVAVRNTDAALLKTRKEALTVGDAIGAEEMSKAGAGSAADAMKRVTGATIVGGKYVNIRGLGGRYSNTLLNGVELPSPDPNKRAVALDLFPSSLLDNINAVKTFSPDMAGNFSGGSVNIRTRAIPGNPTLKASLSGSCNPRVTFRDDFLTYEGGTTDWLGIDDGTRAVPEPLEDRSTEVPSLFSWPSWTSERDSALPVVLRLDTLSRAFSSGFHAEEQRAFPNHGGSFAVGNRFDMAGMPLGLLGSVTYSRKLKSFKDGKLVRWELKGHDSTKTRLDSNSLYLEDNSTDEVLWGTLANVGLDVTEDHKLALLYMYSRNAEDETSYLIAPFHEDVDDHVSIEKRSIRYRQRGLHFGLLEGSHGIPTDEGVLFEWKAAYSNTLQDEPDYRVISNNKEVDDITCDTASRGDTLFCDTTWKYPIQLSIYRPGFHAFRTINEEAGDVKFDVSVPFYQWTDDKGKVKAGMAWQQKSRSYVQREYEYEIDNWDNANDAGKNLTDCEGDVEEYFAEENLGLVDTTGVLPEFGNYLKYENDTTPNHNGWQTIWAGYGMLELPLVTRFRLVGGVRYESTVMNVSSWDKTDTLNRGELVDDSWLPSVAGIFALTDKMNMRAAFSRTLARPTFREKARYVSEELGLEISVGGNPNLRLTHINNYDLRWEWFPDAGELVAVSAFYKTLTDPIDLVYVEGDNDELQYANITGRGSSTSPGPGGDAVVVGTELEVRVGLGYLNPALRDLRIGTNVTLLRTEIQVDSTKAEKLEELRSDPEMTYPLYGASPYLVNANVIYQPEHFGISAGAYFNVFGRRLDFTTMSATPNVYEYPRPDLSVFVAQQLTGRLSVKLRGSNLLNPKIAKAHEYKGELFDREAHFDGRSYSFGLSYSL